MPIHIRIFALALLLIPPALVVGPGGASAKGLDTPGLVAMCKNIDPTTAGNAGECIAYLRGVYEGGMVAYYLGQKKILFCPSAPLARADALRQVFLAYVRDNPSKTGNDPAFVAIKAFTQAYPCTDGPPPPAAK